MHSVEKMAFVGRNPWWLGTAVQGNAVGINLGSDAVTSRIVMEAAELDWDVLKVAAGYRRPAVFNPLAPGAPFLSEPEWIEAGEDCFLIRSRDNNVLGRCHSTYKEFQNVQAFEFLDSLVENGDLLYHTAGSLEGGRRVWILAQTPTSWEIKRRSGVVDTHHAFLLCMLGHTGDIGISLMGTDVRAVCANTCAFADTRAENENIVFRIPHRGDIDAKLKLAGKAIEVMASQAPERRGVLQAMAQAAMSTDEFIDFATSIFLGLEGSEQEISEWVGKFYSDSPDRAKTIMENKVAKVAECFLVGQGNEGDSVYDALQGFTEYFDHFDLGHIRDKIALGKRAAKAVNSAWVGAGAEKKSLVYKRLASRMGA